MTTKQLSIRTVCALATLVLFAAGCGSDPAGDPEGDEPGECSDGVDNDQDGDADCNDSGCFVASVCLDADGDGFRAGDDCDDSDAANYPGNTEICDGQDNDCDGLLDPTEIDDDSDGVTECDGDCDDSDAANYPGNTEICDGQDNDCGGVVDQDDVCERLAFITSTGHDGNLGGLAGADAICTQIATDAGLGSTWVAWLSDDSTAAPDRLTQIAGPYVRLDGLIIADDVADLIDGSIANAIVVDEVLGVQPALRVWTGTLNDGTAASANCENWTNNVVFGGGDGQSNVTTGFWTQLGAARCDFEQPLYCFEL